MILRNKLGFTTNTQLTTYCKKLKINLIGVFNKDELPNNQMNGFYIVNMQSHKDFKPNIINGTHWVCFNLDDDNLYYFDPFGVIYPKEIRTFSQNRNIHYNTKQIEPLDSESCGYYCLLFGYVTSNSTNKLMAMKQFNKIFKPYGNLQNELVLKQIMFSLLK